MRMTLLYPLYRQNEVRPGPYGNGWEGGWWWGGAGLILPQWYVGIGRGAGFLI